MDRYLFEKFDLKPLTGASAASRYRVSFLRTPLRLLVRLPGWSVIICVTQPDYPLRTVAGFLHPRTYCLTSRGMRSHSLAIFEDRVEIPIRRAPAVLSHGGRE